MRGYEEDLKCTMKLTIFMNLFRYTIDIMYTLTMGASNGYGTTRNDNPQCLKPRGTAKIEVKVSKKERNKCDPLQFGRIFLLFLIYFF